MTLVSLCSNDGIRLKCLWACSALVRILVKWLMGLLIRRLVEESLFENDDNSFFMSGNRFMDFLYLDNLSFAYILCLNVLAPFAVSLLTAAMSSIALIHASQTGRDLRHKILQYAVGGSSSGAKNKDESDDNNQQDGEASDVDLRTVASDLILKVKMIEDFRAFKEHKMFTDYFTVLFAVVVILIFSWHGGLITLFLLVVTEVLIGIPFMKLRAKSIRTISSNENIVRARLLDVIKNGVTIKMMNMQPKELEDMRKLEAESDKARRRNAMLFFVQESLMLLSLSVIPVVIATTAWFMIQAASTEKKLDIGFSILVAMLMLEEGHKSIQALAYTTEEQQRAREAQAAVNDWINSRRLGVRPCDSFLDEDEDDEEFIKEEGTTSSAGNEETDDEMKDCFTTDDDDDGSYFSNEMTSSGQFKETLLVDNVSLIFPGRKDPVLKDFGMAFEKGKIHALLGESGSGKSSILKMMAGLLSPSSGMIKMWNNKVKVAYVSQDQHLFSRTIRENVTYGWVNKEPTDDEVWSALRMANIHKWVYSLPNKLEERLDGGELMISGGQLQRLHLAHLFCTGQDADLLLLDECLSAVDKVSREVLIDRLGEFLQGKTSIIITHHSEMLRICDFVHDMPLPSGTKWSRSLSIPPLLNQPHGGVEVVIDP